MKNVSGWWVPDYDEDLQRIVGGPQFAGRSTYQLNAFLCSLPYVRNFRTAIDGGAHVGFWSWYLSHCFDKVKAFEPCPLHIECFSRNISDGRVQLYPVGLGDKVETRTFAIKPPWSLKCRVHTNEPNKIEGLHIVTLDSLNFLEDIDYIKLDLEGFEYFAVKGAEELIRRCKPAMVVEQKPGNARYGLSPTAAVELLVSWGATVHSRAHDDFILSWA